MQQFYFRAPTKGPVHENTATSLRGRETTCKKHACPLMCLIKARASRNKNRSKKDRLNEGNISKRVN